MFDIGKKLDNWLKNFVEVPNKNLNGWSPCPYARQARLDNKIKIIVQELETNVLASVENNLEFLDKDVEVIIFCFDPNKILPEELLDNISSLNKKYSDLIFLEDHPAMQEYINGVKMNFGECVLVLAQKKDKLNDASNKLKNKGYYDCWSQSNLEDIVLWRTK